jgi:hypothetical protein
MHFGYQLGMNDASQPTNPDWIEPTEEDKKCRPHCVFQEEARELFRQYKAGLISKESFESKSGWRFWPIKGGVPEKIPAQSGA